MFKWSLIIFFLCFCTKTFGQTDFYMQKIYGPCWLTEMYHCEGVGFNIGSPKKRKCLLSTGKISKNCRQFIFEIESIKKDFLLPEIKSSCENELVKYCGLNTDYYIDFESCFISMWVKLSCRCRHDYEQATQKYINKIIELAKAASKNEN